MRTTIGYGPWISQTTSGEWRDSRLKVFRDTTKELEEEGRRIEERDILMEQKLANHLRFGEHEEITANLLLICSAKKGCSDSPNEPHFRWEWAIRSVGEICASYGHLTPNG